MLANQVPPQWIVVSVLVGVEFLNGCQLWLVLGGMLQNNGEVFFKVVDNLL